MGRIINPSSIASPSGGGVALTPWTKLANVTQASGVPVDSLSIGDTGTGFTAGEFRHVWASHTVSNNADGYREGVLWWSYPLLTVWPDFDVDLHDLEILANWATADGHSFPLAVNDGAGCFAGIADDALSAGSVNAAIYGMHRAGVSAFQARKLNTTTATSGGSMANQDQMNIHMRFVGASSAHRPIVTSAYRTTGSSPETFDWGSVNPGFETLSTTLANWRIVTGSYHVSATDPAGLDVQWSIWTRIVKRASGPTI